MSCKCGPNCLRRQGRRRECQTCNRPRGAARVGFRDGRKVTLARAGDNAENPGARDAGESFGYTGGKLGVFMQGAASYRNGQPPPLRDTVFKVGYEWAESESHAAY